MRERRQLALRGVLLEDRGLAVSSGRVRAHHGGGGGLLLLACGLARVDLGLRGRVDFAELRVARGMGGKSYLLLTGDVAAVSAAIEAAKIKVGDSGLLLDSSVIPSPDKSLWASIL